MTFPHSIAEMNGLTGKHKHQRGLLVLGGPSGRGWRDLQKHLQPDLLIGVNGTIAAMPGVLDYWLCMESWDRAHEPVWFQDTRAGVRIVTWKRYNMLQDKTNAYAARRGGPWFLTVKTGPMWNPRVYEGGLYHGDLMRRPELHVQEPVPIGTVCIQALHLACILGLSEIHTIGQDMCFKPGAEDHWYPEVPVSHDNIWWDERMFTKQFGLDTTYFWLDSAQLLLRAKARFLQCGMKWTDHSDGLLQAMVGRE